jgi:polysaccharide export outer membrane protein
MKIPSLLSVILAGTLLSRASAQETQPIIPVPPPATTTQPAPAAPPPATPPAVTAGQAGAQVNGPSSAPPGAASPNAQPPAVSPNYVIGPRDGLAISVWKEPNVSGGVEVRPDGMITLPLLGDVKADGFTPTGLAAELTARLKKFIDDPVVTVTVTAINSKHIYLTGNVGHGGELPYSPDMTPMQVIISAGGVSPMAKKTKIYILRTVNGKQVKFFFDYKKALKTGDQQGIVLLPNDTIVVP